MTSEKLVDSALRMDRDGAIGNSEDIDGRRALHVKLKNLAGDSQPVFDGILEALSKGSLQTNDLLLGILCEAQKITFALEEILECGPLSNLDCDKL